MEIAQEPTEVTPITRSYSFGSVPLSDLGVVQADRSCFAPFSSSLHDAPSASALRWSGRDGKVMSGAACPADGPLRLLLLPAVG